MSFPLALLALLFAEPAFAQEEGAPGEPTFIARDVEPTLTNLKDVKRVMRRVYPSSYRDTGIEATAIMWVYVKADGTVGGHQVLRSSGYDVFDHAAGQLVDVMEFTPAMRGGEPVAVWINQAVQFKSGEGGEFIEGPALIAEEPEDSTTMRH